MAMVWITEQVGKKSSSKYSLGERIGYELVAILKGTSSLLPKREAVHKQAIANRSNILMFDMKRK